MDTSGLDFHSHPEQSVDSNYRGIRIKVYRNGDQYDTGTVVVICRKRFKHWLTFLDFLTKKLNLMAPVHEFYRTDGVHIRHFEEIENGGSYVAVSQGPFLHKPYGLPPEDREKWNINPKIESPEQSTLDSAESVDIYLKQRGYTSRTGLPFPFDGGVCANHSLMDVGRNRNLSSNLSIRQHRNELKPEEIDSRNGELLEKNDTKSDSPIEELQKSDPQSKPHPNSNHTEPPASIPEDKSETSLHENKAETMNDQNIEQNDEILRFSTAESANPITNKTGEKNLCSEITIQSNRKPTVKEYDEPLTAPVVQIPDSFREFPLAQDAKNMQSLGPIQTTNSNYYPLTARNPETVITIVNDDALINASSSSVIIVNISGRQKKRDSVNNVSDDAEIGLPLVNKVMDIKVPSESSGMKMAQFPDGTRIVNRMQDTNEVRTPMAIHIDHVSPTATTPTGRLSPVSVNTEGQRSKTVSPKIDRKSNDKSSKINSKGCSANKFETSQNVMLEQNLAAKLKEKPKQKTNLKANQSDKQVCDTSKNDAKLDEVSKDSKEPTSLSMQRNEFEHISDSSGYDKENDSADKSQLSQKSIVAGTDEIQTTCTASNSIKIHESSITNNNSSDKKRVTLVTPSVTDINLEMESEKAKIFSDSEGQLNSSSKHTVTGNSSATTTTSVITTAAITNTTTSNSMTDITQCTTASKDVIMHTTTAEKEIPNLQQKYQSENETSFEADFTPRDSRIQRNSTHMKTSQKIKIDVDLNMGVCGLSKQSSYDPDFKDYDFI